MQTKLAAGNPLSLRYFFLFVALLTLAFVAYFGAHVSAATPGTLPPGTIPPGNPPPFTQTKITVVHAAPISANAAETAVDVCTDENQVVTGLSGLEYLDNASVVLNPGRYDLKVAKAGTNCIDLLLDIAPITLGAGQEVILILTGDGVNQPLGSLLVIQREGTQYVYLPVIARP